MNFRTQQLNAPVFVMSGVALALSACSPPHPHHDSDKPLRTVTALDCPASKGSLRLSGAPATATSCSTRMMMATRSHCSSLI